MEWGKGKYERKFITEHTNERFKIFTEFYHHFTGKIFMGSVTELLCTYIMNNIILIKTLFSNHIEI